MKLLLKLHFGRYNSSSLIPLQGNDSCWSYFQQEPILLHDREFAVVRVSLSAGLYLNFNASPILVSLPDKREDRSEKRERVWCIYSCLYLWSGAPRRPFDFTTLEFAENKFSTGPFLLSSGYGMIMAQRNPRAVQYSKMNRKYDSLIEAFYEAGMRSRGGLLLHLPFFLDRLTGISENYSIFLLNFSPAMIFNSLERMNSEGRIGFCFLLRESITC